MPVALRSFLHYAYLILFLWVLAEQLGIPIPERAAADYRGHA